ncbi:hypothetical protein SARC_02262 [Sphaeroforma arctica JP610]|uniref:Pherophorin domain-containing protein n=1 Tax=Sphaeroforma arctica JP610 TaxID=667725 RepID=A0A0L0GBG5_9EUKA|nr:hypothetical protein SARC_02262 [Sphaeroforma arctica JP610]KNC85573.1 hypothetical protein SARC_02262 [Sphaeroforma arctica JP610]|eukprot:XP_014159475.1 hypothetical protein SARC_02262 [Sphaeroforma arctica JP610]
MISSILTVSLGLFMLCSNSAAKSISSPAIDQMIQYTPSPDQSPILPPPDLDFRGNNAGYTVECSTADNIAIDTPIVNYALCFYAVCEIVSWTNEENSKGVGRCGCVAWHGSNYVGVDSILNDTLSKETLQACPEGSNSAGCSEPNSAPICQYVNNPKNMYVDLPTGPAELISDFSLAFSGNESGDSIYGWKLSSTDREKGLYASCMTAPCYNESITLSGVRYPVTCLCPIVEHEFTVGQDGIVCQQENGLVWNASYNLRTIIADAE